MYDSEKGSGKLCPICLRDKDPHKMKCSACKKLPINISLDCETYPHKNPHGE
jgi:hypothetical protein